MPLDLPYDPERLAEICRRYHVTRLELFGSRARGEARADSDVDLMVSFEGDQTPGFAFVTLAEELEAVFARPVDLLVRDTVERDENPIRQRSILDKSEELYAA
jgi:predicted nucleotidyltransferase